MTQRDVVFPSARRTLYERHRYSPAIRSNGFLFVSGQVGSTEDGTPEPDLKNQVRQAFTNLNAILAEAGASFDDVVDVTVFIVDPQSKFETIWNVVLTEFWGEAPHPTVTAVGVTWLYGFDFEIKVIARLPEAA
jgi:enamine deaminase RidA (YjgF/YER057c/UK114 family)